MELKKVTLPKMFSELNYSNSFFKRVCLILLGLLVVELILIIHLSLKEPLILTFTQTGVYEHSKKEMPKAQDLVEQAIHQYMGIRYVWVPKNVNEKFNAAEAFILNESLINFRQAVGKVIALAKEKGIAQKIFIEKVEVNLKKLEAVVFGERIIVVDKLRVVNAIKVKLTFEHGPMSEKNPWGVYVVKEEEELR